MALTELERAAMLIVLETPRRSDNATQSYVRRELIAMLEMALRNQGHGPRLDAALRLVRDIRRDKSVARDAKIAAYRAEGGQ